MQAFALLNLSTMSNFPPFPTFLSFLTNTGTNLTSMKKVIALVLVLLASLFFLRNSHAEYVDAYYYGFILSCREVYYLTSPIKLSDEALLDLTDQLEKEHCGPTSSDDLTKV